MSNTSKLENSESPNAADGFQFDSGEPKPPRPDITASSSASVDSQSDDDFQPKFWKSTGYFQEISQSAASVQEISRPAVEFEEKSKSEDRFQEKSWPSNVFQEKSWSTADVPEKSRAGKINRPKSKMITSASAALATALARWLRRKPQKLFSDVPTEEDPATHLGWVKRFSLQELQVATDSFRNGNILGRGIFGEVYKGRLADGSLVAVKRVKAELITGGELQFLKKVEMTSMSIHRNLFRLHGFCMTSTECLLVYPFKAYGSVALWLRKRRESQPSLNWRTRKRIALGSARGLSYLHDHCDPKIIHRDVYGYGIMLMELITGKQALDLARLGVKGFLKEKNLEMLVDPDLKNNYVESELEQLILVALLCIQGSPMDRPMMSEVVRMLEGDRLAERWNKWQNVELPLHFIDWNVDSTDILHAIVLSGPS